MQIQAPVGPVVLVTVGVPFDERAAAYAVDTAVQTGAPLVVVNCTALEPLRMSLVFGYDALEELTPEVSTSVRRSVELAVSLGVAVERLRVRSPRPVTALIELAAERRPGVLVFGPDRAKVARRAFARTVQALRDRTTCLIWIVPDRA